MKTVFAAAILWAVAAQAQTEIHVPQQVNAGTKVSISFDGSGNATFILLGPGHISKREVKLGSSIQLEPEETADAGRYVAILQSGGDTKSESFYVQPGEPSRLSVIAHPSRAPVSLAHGINAAVYPFDRYDNLVLKPIPVTFTLSLKDGGQASHETETKNGISYLELDSPAHGGAAQLEASSGEIKTLRVIQIVAGEACTLRIFAHPATNGVAVETEPVKDCSGNLVPDGTLVTFTEWNGNQRSTIDVSVKKGIARAVFPGQGDLRISAASGVAMGNELRVRSGQ